jgi:hypothetical protein
MEVVAARARPPRQNALAGSADALLSLRLRLHLLPTPQLLLKPQL